MQGFDREIELFLATSRTATLATVDGEGCPYAANVQYAHDSGWRLIWVSSPTSQHSRHLAERADAALTVYAHRDHAETLHGLQLRGTVAPAIAKGQAEWRRVWDRYTAKFDFVRSLPQFRDAAERQSFYVFTPSWLRWIDNRRGFGWKVEKELSA
ncbi:MAG: pyridoxamine 5'-phosphate oxidase family protein [Planctomycetota bacterium]